MEWTRLVKLGEQLSADLEAGAERYDVRSDLRHILEYESARVSAYVARLAHRVPVAADVRKPALLGEWGRGYTWDEDDLIRRTTEFYRALQKLGVETD